MKTVEWAEGKIRIIDQTKLPLVEEVLELHRIPDVAEAIRSLRVRGAPAIGVTAALSVAMAAHQSHARNSAELLEDVEATCELIGSTRPTAVNLFWALERMRDLARRARELPLEDLRRLVIGEAKRIAEEDEETCRRIGLHGSTLIQTGDSILTHCNAGALACSDYGTALGVIRAAHEQGKRVQVYADETRPLLQGARLTAWELKGLGIPVTVITDSMAGMLMSMGRVGKVIVGADRIAANGDVANKIGTYSLAVLARHHGVPFYVAAPTSTVDLRIEQGSQIPIEQRRPEEVTSWNGTRVAPEGVSVFNPAFDVTPAALVTGIITERGVVSPPYKDSLAALFAGVPA